MAGGRRRWAVAVVAAVGVASSCTRDVARDSPAPTPAVSAPATDAPSRSRPRQFTIAATGDILIHSPVAAAASTGSRSYDFDPLFRAVRPVLRRADLAVCHLETPLSRHNFDLSYYPRFRVPRQLAPALRHAGYDYCSTASNHAFDAGFDGVQSTLDVLDRVGIAHDGTARDRREAGRPAGVRVNGVRVALLSYTYGLNGLASPAGAPWAVNLIDPRRIASDARRARRDGAEFVVVSLHWGNEYVTEPTADQRHLARRVMRSPAVDLVIGHHAHVVQPVDRVRGRVVLYGLGNFVSNQSSACCPIQTQDGVIVHLRVRETRGGFRITRVAQTPTWMSRAPYEVLPIQRALRLRTLPGPLAESLRASFDRTRRAIGMLGFHARQSARGFAR